MNHTKLPWIATTVEKTGNDWLICYVGNDYENMEWIITTDRIHASEMNGSDAKDDATFIVKAVNNHQKLVEALKFYADTAIAFDGGNKAQKVLENLSE